MPSIIDLLHMLSFKNMDKKRDRHIVLSSSRMIKKNFKINNAAEDLHPHGFKAVVKEVIPSGKDCLLVTFEPGEGESFPYFRAGQYVVLERIKKDYYAARPYSICSSPNDAKNGCLKIMIKRVPGGCLTGDAAGWLEPEREVEMHGPFGDFVHDYNRDCENVIALAGGSGITPFLSMALAIAEGDENFNLTILYGAKDRDSICLYEEIKRVADTEDRVRLVPILSDEKRDGFETGFITMELINKHIPLDIDGGKAPVSIYVCGPEPMYQAMEKILLDMGFDKKHVRFECAPGEKPERSHEKVDITVKFDDGRSIRDNGYSLENFGTLTISGYKDTPILMSLEAAEIMQASRCRSGSCGYCRGRVTSGQVTTPPMLTDDNRLNYNGYDHRRETDKEMGMVHLCVTYPDSDIVIEIPKYDRGQY